MTAGQPPGGAVPSGSTNEHASGTPSDAVTVTGCGVARPMSAARTSATTSLTLRSAHMDVRAVGVFDSGVGGLTVLHECLVTLPHEDFVYLGDHARLPYGPRPLDEVRAFAREIGAFLEAQDVKLIVVACNTATSAAMPQLQAELTVPVIGVIAQDAGVDLVSVACPRLVPLIEGADPYGEDTEEAVREYAAHLRAAGVDTVILGCTHYPLIRPVFQRVFGRDVTLVFSAEETAREVADTLARKRIENDASRAGAYRFLTTGDPASFREMG